MLKAILFLQFTTLPKVVKQKETEVPYLMCRYHRVLAT